MKSNSADLRSAGEFIAIVDDCLTQGIILTGADKKLKSALSGALDRALSICQSDDPTPSNCQLVDFCLAQVLYLHFDKILFPPNTPRELIQGFLDCIEIALSKLENPFTVN